MKKVTIQEVRDLVAARAVPSVSIYVGTDRGGSGGAGDRSRLRGLFRRASDMLAPSLGRSGVDALLAPLAERAREAWPRARAVALLGSPDTSAAFALPVDVPDLAVVSSTFHTKPLVSLVDGAETFVLLALGDGIARAYDATPDALAPAAHLLPTARGTSPAARQAWHAALDAALEAHLREAEEVVVLAGAREEREAFRAASRYPFVLDEGIECDLAQVQVRDLLAPARAIAQAHRAEVEAEAAAQYVAAAAAGRATDDLRAVAQAAVAGRVQLLVHRRGVHLWGTLDARSGACALRAGAPRAGEADVIDDLVEIVLQHGGDVVEVAGERMPSSAPVAAVVRGALAVAPRRRERRIAQGVSP
jgi:Bacterial archaeo-eukaryotic release factor family 3